MIENPFDDIVPRITAAEKREQMKAKLEAKVEMEKRDKRSKAKKWVHFSVNVPTPEENHGGRDAKASEGEKGTLAVIRGEEKS